MIRKLFTLLAITLASFSFAADPSRVVTSGAPFDGAIDSISDTTIISHIPGYGLNVNAWSMSRYDLGTITSQLQGIVLGLSPLVIGLDAGDWVSVAWVGTRFSGNDDYIVVRVKPGLPDTLETYVNGILLD